MIGSGRVYAQKRRHTFSSNELHPVPSSHATSRSTIAVPKPLAGAFQLNVNTMHNTCAGINGLITVNPSGGTPPYIYSFDGGPWQYSGIKAINSSAAHTVDVKDGTGALVSGSIAAYIGDLPQVTATGVDPSNCTASDGAITAQGSGGTPPYLFSLDKVNWQGSPTFNGLPAGTYAVWIKDAKGCMYNDAYGNVLLKSCVVYASNGGGPTCGQANGSLGYLADGPSRPYTYSLDGTTPYQSVGFFQNLAAGTYTIHIKDGNGVVYLYRYALLDYCGLEAHATTTDASCGLPDGQISATGVNGTGPYQYSIDGIHFQSTNTFTGLASGRYTIMVKDAVNNWQLVDAVVSDNCPSAAAAATANACGGNNGEVTVTASGGTSPYQYSIDGGTTYQGSNIFHNLTAGTYTITVRDAVNNTGTTTITVDNSCLKATAAPTNVVCGHVDGTITGQGSGGTAPYTYSLDGSNFQSSQVFYPLPAGNYTLWVKDASGSTASTPVTITDAPGATISSVTTGDAECSGLGATITIIANGGTAPLKYSIDGTHFQLPNGFNNAPVGTFTAYVQDANGCQVTQTGEIFKRCLQLTAVTVNPGCNNNDGIITAVASDGFPPYTYSIDGINFYSTPEFPNLAAGNYRIYVLDSRAQTSAFPVNLQQICIQATATPGDATCGANNGTLDINASGGIAPYSYSIDGGPFGSNAHITSLAAGPHTVNVDDSKGNSMMLALNVTINAIPPPSMTFTPTAATCAGNDGTVTINGAGGTMPYQYRLDNGSYGSGATFGGLSSGTHQAYIQDASGCVVQAPVDVPLNDNLTVNGGPDVPVCQGKSGVIQATSNATSFSWQPATGLSNPNILQPTVTPTANTTYTLTASNGNCQKTATVNVIVNPLPTAVAGPGANICNGKTYQLKGSGGQRYSWTPAAHLDNPSIANPTVSGLTATTTYQLTVTDANGCSSVNSSYATVTLTPPPRVFAGNDTAVMLGQPVPLHAVDVDNVGVGGWVWTPGTYLDNDVKQDPIAQPQQTITYLLTGRTFNGCEGTAHITINVYATSGVFVPTAFTPNGDGHNDVFRPVLVSAKELKYFAVFDRWGQRVFYTTSPAEGWRGTSNGKEQPMGTYVWMVGAVDFNGKLVQQKGTVLLIR